MMGRATDTRTRYAAFASHVRDEDHSSSEYEDIYGTQEPEAKLDRALLVLGGRE